MEKFIVSARKYRPQNFNAVIGQEHITTTLKNAITNNQLAHAFLFCGPRGVGKTTCARILAKTINCEHRTEDGEACNTCNSCVSFNNGTSFNIHELDAASNNSVDNIRTLVEQIRFAPQAGQYKVYIIDEVHMLSQSAFNAFLKTLEEPPPFAIFILATTEKHKILPTILSRCQIFDFKRITPQDTVKHLHEIAEKENIKTEKTALHLIAQKSEGCLRDALSIMDKIVSFTNGEITYANTLEHLNILDEDYFFKMLENMQEQNLPASLLLYDEINQKGFEADTFLDGFSEFVRNLLVSKDKKSASLLEVAEDFKPRYKKMAETISIGWLLASLNILSETATQLRLARNRKLLVEMTLIKLTYLKQAVELVETDNLSGKKKVIDKKGAIAFKVLSPIEATPNAKKTKPVILSDNAKLTIEGNTKKDKKIEAKASPKTQGQTFNEPPIEEMKIMGSIADIRSRVAGRQLHQQPAREITNEAVQEMWNLYKQKLAVNSPSILLWFNDAQAGINSNKEIEISVNSSLLKNAIEDQRSDFLDHLHRYFRNNELGYVYHLTENTNPTSEEKPLSAKERYAQLSSMNPLIAQLKDTLGLELE